MLGQIAQLIPDILGQAQVDPDPPPSLHLAAVAALAFGTGQGHGLFSRLENPALPDNEIGG
ncbi:MAG: hypothetical protein GY927_19435 [bacterium]|nr:hypothetical protein [bacterium]